MPCYRNANIKFWRDIVAGWCRKWPEVCTGVRSKGQGVSRLEEGGRAALLGGGDRCQPGFSNEDHPTRPEGSRKWDIRTMPTAHTQQHGEGRSPDKDLWACAAAGQRLWSKRKPRSPPGKAGGRRSGYALYAQFPCAHGQGQRGH